MLLLITAFITGHAALDRYDDLATHPESATFLAIITLMLVMGGVLRMILPDRSRD